MDWIGSDSCSDSFGLFFNEHQASASTGLQNVGETKKAGDLPFSHAFIVLTGCIVLVGVATFALW